jgi:MFS family permease
LTYYIDADRVQNWPAWKKDLAFVSLLVSAAVVGILKTLFVTTNSVIMAQYNVSYTAAAALTGVPFILAALSGLGSAVLSQVIGKRTIHIAATLVMLAGAVWNMRTMGSYPQFMFSRIFQGAGWGAFEGIVMLSVRDIFAVRSSPSSGHI